MRARATATLAFALLVSTHPARAAGDEAKQHFEAGVGLVEKHDFAAAIGEFQRSYELNAVPEALFDIALCQRALGHNADALDTLHRYVTEASASGKLDPARKKETDDLLRELAPPETRAPEVAPPPPVATTAPPPPAPIVVAPPVDARPLGALESPQGRVALGLGIGALVVVAAAATTGGIVLSEKSTYDAGCATRCDQSLYDQAHTLAITTDVMIGVSAAAAVTALVLFLTRPRQRDLHALVGPHGLGFQWQGEF